MRKFRTITTAVTFAALMTVMGLPVSILAQTKVVAPKNPFSIEKDVELGRQAAAEVERQLPVLNDRAVDGYVERIGYRLVEGMPRDYQHPQFRYSFKVIDASDINAFALPGGFTYVNRGLINAARNEGELAGVMAHEIAHVALRHGTAQAAKAQKFQWGAAAGQILGAVIGGGLGNVVSAGSQLGIGAYFLKYGRDYERQADILGAQIMANAGYDPRDLANMFRTIERESKSGGPEWLSSHPNPGNRYEAINREAQLLNVRAGNQDSYEFDRVKSRLGGMPRARSMQEISRSNQRYPVGSNRQPGGRVAYPSGSFRTYDGGNQFRIGVPSNWQVLDGNGAVTFAPDGAYGEVQGRFIFTHGAMVGIMRADGRDLVQATETFVRELAQNNPNMRQQGRLTSGAIDNREAVSVTFSNVSDVTGRSEIIRVYTAFTRNGDLFYMVGVAPQDEFRSYDAAFQNMIRSLQLA